MIRLSRYAPIAVGLFVMLASAASARAAVAPAGRHGAETVLYKFRTFADGAVANPGLLQDSSGAFIGSTYSGGGIGGVVFKLAPARHGTYAESVLYTFGGNTDGDSPNGPLIEDAGGSIYGSTDFGGSSACFGEGCGTVYKLTPAGSGAYTESILYVFSDAGDGAHPYGPLVADAGGALYGTTEYSGSGGCVSDHCGAIFKLTPAGSGAYTESIIYVFTGGKGGQYVSPGLLVDASGALYGTTGAGGAPNLGVAFKLTPQSGTYVETVLHTFRGRDGATPDGALIADAAGDLYGATADGGEITNTGCSVLGRAPGCGAVFELSPHGGGYVETVLHRFSPSEGLQVQPGLLADAHGDLFGAARLGGSCSFSGQGGCGTAFELVPRGGRYTLRVLRDFAGGVNDGLQPNGNIVQGADGALYGTTILGGGTGCVGLGCGTVYRLTY